MFTPRKCGVKYDPPTLVLYYVIKASGKVHRRSMPLRNFTANSNVDEVVTSLKSKHQRYLENIPLEQLQRLISKIQENIKISEKETKTEDGEGTTGLEDLNKLSDEALDRKKAEMDTVFDKHRLKPGDEGFEYEVEVEFDGAKNVSDWDSDNNYSDPEF